MSDVEMTARHPVANPYHNQDTTGVLPVWHPINVLWRTLYMALSMYGLFYFQAYDTILRNPNVRHEWFKIGLAATTAILLLKAYVELYAGKLNKQKISYKTFPQTTHAVLLLIGVSSLAFNIALWPVYGAGSMLVMSLVGMFILNFCLLMPTYIQNMVAFVLFSFFLQQYS